MLDRQITGEDEPVVADSARLAALEQEQQTEKKKEALGRRLFTHLWEEGWSPFQVVRFSLFWGPMLVGKVRVRSYATSSSATDRVGITVLFSPLWRLG
jgi:cardiolipin-specific phospholipase